MADRNKGEKSTVRIARSSWEQNGYERHRTRPVPVSSGGTLTASRSPHGDAEKICKPEKGFKRSVQFFLPSGHLVNGRGKSVSRVLQRPAAKPASFPIWRLRPPPPDG